MRWQLHRPLQACFSAPRSNPQTDQSRQYQPFEPATPIALLAQEQVRCHPLPRGGGQCRPAAALGVTIDCGTVDGAAQCPLPRPRQHDTMPTPGRPLATPSDGEPPYVFAISCKRRLLREPAGQGRVPDADRSPLRCHPLHTSTARWPQPRGNEYCAASIRATSAPTGRIAGSNCRRRSCSPPRDGAGEGDARSCFLPRSP